MENASKALIIAGAILIAILLIGIGVMVMRGASAPVEQATDQASAQAIEMYNSKFAGYAGIQTSAVAKELLNQVIATNATNPNNQIVVLVRQIGNGTAFTIEAGLKKLGQNPQLKWIVTLNYAQNTIKSPPAQRKIKGYISSIDIRSIT